MFACVFPGQGAQRVGMGKALVERFPVAREIFEKADSVLRFGLTKLCFEGPEDDLQLTTNSQPALLTVSVAVWRVLQQEIGLTPEVVAGHSLGEYSALVCANALAFEDALRLVRKRGELMQNAVSPGLGAMAAIIGLDNARVEELCKESAQGQVLTPANYNAPSQLVISGHAGAVARATKKASEIGAVSKLLRVSAPFHCPLMEPAAAKLGEELKKVSFSNPEIPVISNVDAMPYQDGGKIATLLVRQMTASVQWEATIRRLAELGVTDVLELGCGKTLKRLIESTDKSLMCYKLETPEELEELKRREADAWLVTVDGVKIRRDGSRAVWPDGRAQNFRRDEWSRGINGTLIKKDGTWIVWPGEAEHFREDEWLLLKDLRKVKRDGTRSIDAIGRETRYAERDWNVGENGLRIRRDGQLVIWPDGRVEELLDAEWDCREDGARIKKDRTRIITYEGKVEDFHLDEWEVREDGSWHKKDGTRIIWSDGLEWDFNDAASHGF
jgi:[acyl-carrier-protein] S-malonyltransferase